MVPDSHIERREVTPSPRPFSSPLASFRINGIQYTKQRHHEVLVERVPNETQFHVLNGANESEWLNSLPPAVLLGSPCPLIDPLHARSFILATVPTVSLKGAVFGVERPPGRIQLPVTTLCTSDARCSAKILISPFIPIMECRQFFLRTSITPVLIAREDGRRKTLPPNRMSIPR